MIVLTSCRQNQSTEINVAILMDRVSQLTTCKWFIIYCQTDKNVAICYTIKDYACLKSSNQLLVDCRKSSFFVVFEKGFVQNKKIVFRLEMILLSRSYGKINIK